MDGIIQGLSNLPGTIFPGQQQMYRPSARDGRQSQALIIACADSRVSPEHITQSGPGELFVRRNAGDVVQLNKLPTHPSAAALARGKLRRHGWFFEIESGQVLACCGERSRFIPIDETSNTPVAHALATRIATPEDAGLYAVAAE